MKTLVREEVGEKGTLGQSIKGLEELRVLCQSSSNENVVKLAKIVADSNCPVSRLAAFVREAASRSGDSWYAAGKIVWQQLLDDGDRHRALIMADVFSLSQAWVTRVLGCSMYDWFEKVVKPKFSEQGIEVQLVLLSMAFRDCQDGDEQDRLIELFGLLKLPDDSLAERLAFGAEHNIADSSGKDFWLAYIEGIRALVA